MLGKIPSWLRLSHEISSVEQVPTDFFGVNIATSDDPRCDDYIVNALRELSIANVRMDFSYSSIDGSAQRLLERVLAEDFDVLLDIFPSREEATRLADDSEAQQRWREFVETVFQRYGGRVSIFEIGSTPNRRKWSGFEGLGYLVAWDIAARVADSYNASQSAAVPLTLAGPNISDFEPFYNYCFLSAMKRQHSVPAVHTDNLFVERVVQPEALDHRVLGSWVNKETLQLNLVKKARIIAHIGQQLGIEKTFCTYKCWTRKRLNRWSADPEQKHADYMLRYLVIAAASGALNRVYWGALICNRDGLIDCGNSDYPVVDNVSFYCRVRGSVDDFKPSKAYNALKFISPLLRGLICRQGISADNGINHFVFQNADGEEQHFVWCLDRYAIPLVRIYPEGSLREARFFNGFGEEHDEKPRMLNERPLLIRWPSGHQVFRPKLDDIRVLEDVAASGVIYNHREGLQPVPVDTPQWQGVVALPIGCDVDSLLERYMPAALNRTEEVSVLRDSRNRLWNVKLDESCSELQTVKLNRAKGIKKLTYRFQQSKGLRQWNNATEMLRRGINTPEPLAFFERHHSKGIEDNYYVCRFIDNAFSCRHVFNAINLGEDSYRGIEKLDYIEQISGFVARMHSNNIVHRDLSSGNLVMTEQRGELTFYTIDIGRALISSAKFLSPRQRFVDLNRICYKLDWAHRQLFIDAYFRHVRQQPPRWWKQSLASYDLKQDVKKMLRGKYKRKHRYGVTA